MELEMASINNCSVMLLLSMLLCVVGEPEVVGFDEVAAADLASNNDDTQYFARTLLLLLFILQYLLPFVLT